MATAAAASEPRIGPASPTRASAAAFSPSERAAITAPMNGMNIGALALMPSRRSAITWPISCTKRSATRPIAKLQPKNRLYAATDTSAVAEVLSSLIFGSSRRIVLNFASSATIAAPAALSFSRTRERRRAPKGSVWGWGAGGSSCALGGGGTGK